MGLEWMVSAGGVLGAAVVYVLRRFGVGRREDGPAVSSASEVIQHQQALAVALRDRCDDLEAELFDLAERVTNREAQIVILEEALYAASKAAHDCDC
jgi:hypothetical protein